MSSLDPKSLDRLCENTKELKVLIEKLLKVFSY